MQEQYVVIDINSQTMAGGLVVSNAEVRTAVKWASYVQLGDIVIMNSKQWQVWGKSDQPMPVMDGKDMQFYYLFQMRSFDDKGLTTGPFGVKAEFSNVPKGRIEFNLDDPDKVTDEMERRVLQDMREKSLIPPDVEYNEQGVGVNYVQKTLVFRDPLSENGIKRAIAGLPELGIERLWVGGKLVYDKNKAEREEEEKLLNSYRRTGDFDKRVVNPGSRQNKPERPTVKPVKPAPKPKSNPLDRVTRQVDLDD